MKMQNKEGRRPRFVLGVHHRTASRHEAIQMGKALDRLLTELIRQERAYGENDHESFEKQFERPLERKTVHLPCSAER